MGKIKGHKKKHQSAPSKEYRVGTMGDLIAKSCGISKPTFDPKLAALFSSPDSNSVVKVQEKTEEVFSAPTPKLGKDGKLDNKREFSLTNKDAANIRVGVKAKFAISASAEEEEDDEGGEWKTVLPKPKQLKRLQTPNSKVKKPRHRDRTLTNLEDVTESDPLAPKISTESINAAESESTDPKTLGVRKESGTAGAIKKTLRQRNAPKEKNPELESRTLFVGNVPKEATKKQLMKLFKGLGGSIETVRLRCGAPDKPTSLKKVAINRKELHPDRASIAAYIRFSTREEAEQVIEKSKAQSLTLSDHHLVLDLADRSIKKDNKKAIFVGNLHLKTQDDDVWEFFSECGQIESVRVVRDRDTGLGKGFGYVNFVDRAAVELALKKDGTEFKNRALRISRCVKKLKKTVENNGVTGKGKFFPSGKINSADSTAKPRTDERSKYKSPKKISQGQRQRKEVQQFSGDRTAEVGKFKRNSKKPNRDEMKKARIAQQLSSTNSSGTVDYKAKKKEMRKLSKPRWRNKDKTT